MAICALRAPMAAGFSRLRNGSGLCEDGNVLNLYENSNGCSIIASHTCSPANEVRLFSWITRCVPTIETITDNYLLSIEGRCAFEVESGAKPKVAVTCKTGPSAFKKHTLGLSDNVTFFSEQMEAADVSVFHYRVTFKPQSLLRDYDFRGSTSDLPRDQK